MHVGFASQALARGHDPREEQLHQIRREWGLEVHESPKQWSGRMLMRAGKEPGLFHLPRQLSQEERQGMQPPKNLPIYEEIKRRFHGAFTWEIRDTKVHHVFYPTVAGMEPTLFDLLVMPIELADGFPDFLRTLSFGRRGASPWQVQVSRKELVIPKDMTAQCLQVLAEWMKIFPKEDTFVQGHFGVPSLFIRLDCVWNDGQLGIYEVEERPSGIGINLEINPQFKRLFAAVQSEWPDFVVVVSPERWRRGGDDHVWAKEVSFRDALESNSLVLVRAEPEEQIFHRFASRSVSTVVAKGLKSYGVPLGLWEEVRWTEQSLSLPWKQGFCLKPLRGSKTRNVLICPPAYEHRGKETQALAHIQANRSMYIQPFILPMAVEINEKPYHAIHRIFFGWNPVFNSWVPLGGGWDARPAPEYLIHGAMDAVSGPSLLEE